LDQEAPIQGSKTDRFIILLVFSRAGTLGWFTIINFLWNTESDWSNQSILNIAKPFMYQVVYIPALRMERSLPFGTPTNWIKRSGYKDRNQLGSSCNWSSQWQVLWDGSLTYVSREAQCMFGRINKFLTTKNHLCIK
jgi:hypothetical protein